MSLAGIIPPLVTPIEADGEAIDAEALSAYVESLDPHVHGLFPCGSTGEFPSLTREQRRTVVEIVSDASADDTPILAGCGGTSVGGVIDHVRDAADAGADAAVVVTPYYFSGSKRGLRSFFEGVADEAPLPIVLYNIPAYTGRTLPVELVSELAEHRTVAGIKDSSGDLGYHHRVLASTPSSFAVLQGTSHLAAAALDLGCDGVTPGVANVFPEEVVRIYDRHRAGEREDALELMERFVHPLTDAISTMPTAPAFKRLLALAGHDVGPPLPPLSPLSRDDAATLEREYEAIVETM